MNVRVDTFYEPSIPPPRMPLALRPPLRSTCLALRSSLRLILPLEGFSSDIANDFPAALDFLDGRHYLNPFSWSQPPPSNRHPD